MRQLLVDYLNHPNDGNKLGFFLREWFQKTSPSRPPHEIDHITNTYLSHLQHVPAMFDSRYQNFLQWTIDKAKVELGVNLVMDKEGKIIKHY